MLQPVIKELFKDEEQERNKHTLLKLQREIDHIKSNDLNQKENTSIQRENEIFREIILKRLDGLQDTIHTQRTELQEQRILLLRLLEYHQRMLQRLNNPPGQMIVDLEETF